MKTTSVLINSLCVPCADRCRYCMLSWSGKVEGADWDRSVGVAERFLRELREKTPDVRRSFSFGYSMEHPDLINALKTLKRLGSPLAEFLQCDGMKMRDADECRILTDTLASEGVKQLNFTVYGEQGYHDRFAGRKGDFELITRMIKAAKDSGISVSAGVPLTAENAGQADGLVKILGNAGCDSVRLFVPHAEGRGRLLSAVRLTEKDLLRVSEETRKLLNSNVYRAEREWLKEADLFREDKRMILISLRKDNIEEYEKRDAPSVVAELERLDEEYYSSFPDFKSLSCIYGDGNGDKLYSKRDLFAHYRALYAKEHGVSVYDVTDERQSGSRRY